jgi:hypothetical protein
MQIATEAQFTRTLSALTETTKLLARETAYLPQNQKQDRIEFYSQHIAKLSKMIDAYKGRA